jgi:hypothetical protein
VLRSPPRDGRVGHLADSASRVRDCKLRGVESKRSILHPSHKRQNRARTGSREIPGPTAQPLPGSGPTALQPDHDSHGWPDNDRWDICLDDDRWEICSPYRDDPGYRWVVFAAAIILLVGLINVVEGLAAVGNPSFFIRHPHLVVGNLTVWGPTPHQHIPGSLATRGWIGVISGVAGIAVGAGVLIKNQLSRWVGAALLGWQAIAQLLGMPDHPLVAAAILTLDTIALYALIGYGKRFAPADIDTTLSQGAADGDASSGSMQGRISARPTPHAIELDVRGSETEEARTWTAWRRSAQKVTRAWNEWLAADHRSPSDRYRRYLSALGEEERAAVELARVVSNRGLDAEKPRS